MTVGKEGPRGVPLVSSAADGEVHAFALETAPAASQRRTAWETSRPDVVVEGATNWLCFLCSPAAERQAVATKWFTEFF